MTLTSPHSFATMGLGARNTSYKAVSCPTESGNFLCLSIFGWGAAVRKAAGMALYMLRTPRPPYTCRNVKGGYQSHKGDLTMSNTTDLIGRQEQPCIIQVHSIPFDVCQDSHFFSTTKDIAPDCVLPHVACLLAGVRDIIQSEAEADMFNDGKGITNTHYAILSILSSAEALINSIQIFKGEAK